MQCLKNYNKHQKTRLIWVLNLLTKVNMLKNQVFTVYFILFLFVLLEFFFIFPFT